MISPQGHKGTEISYENNWRLELVGGNGMSTSRDVNYLCFVCGFDSMWTAAEMNHVVSPMAIRQWSVRLRKIAREFDYE